MAHLLEAEELDELGMEHLFDYLRGRSLKPERRSNTCLHCNGDVVLDPEGGFYVCVSCGVVVNGRAYYVDSWDDQDRCTVPPREGYKPIHHWHERIAQYHLEETRICAADWMAIVEALLLARPKQLCKETIRKILRGIRLQRYNENWLQIINRVTGYVPPRLLQNELILLDKVFDGVCAPFHLFKSKARKNLLNYNFVLYRLFELIGRHDGLRHFPQLKTRSKWLELDRVWAQICAFNRWEHPAYDGHAWLSIPMSDVAWSRVEAELFDAAFECASCSDKGRPKRARPTHNFAARKILRVFSNAAALNEARGSTPSLPRAPRSAMTKSAAMRRLRGARSGSAGGASKLAAR